MIRLVFIFQDLIFYRTKKVPKNSSQYWYFRHGGETHFLVLAQTLIYGFKEGRSLYVTMIPSLISMRVGSRAASRAHNSTCLSSRPVTKLENETVLDCGGLYLIGSVIKQYPARLKEPFRSVPVYFTTR